MSSAEAPKPLSLSLKISGGVIGIPREITVNGNQLTHGPISTKQETPRPIIDISETTVDELAALSIRLDEKKSKSLV